MTKGEHTNERTYVGTGQTLYSLHNFVVRGDNNYSYSYSLFYSLLRFSFKDLFLYIHLRMS